MGLFYFSPPSKNYRIFGYRAEKSRPIPFPIETYFLVSFLVNMEIRWVFGLVVFNFLFSNGDAHLKNFSLLETAQGDYILSPAYDLINTRLHVKDPELALKDGLFKDDYNTQSFEANGFLSYDDFWELGLKIGLINSRLARILNVFRTPKSEVGDLTERSYLDETSKKLYLDTYQTRLKALNSSFLKLI